MDNYRSRENRTNETIQAQMWFSATRGGKKSFNHHECWEVVKYCKRFIIIQMGPAVVLNETSLRDSTTSDSPLDSPMSQDSPIEKESRPISRKAAKFLEEIARQNAIRIEMEQKRQDNEMAIQAEYAREMEYLRKKDMDKTDRETMAMDTSHMSPETKQFWKLERRDVMRRRLFRDDGPSNTDWLNDENH
ncbi:zinc ion-binding protein [Prunus dulcis]|uniref:Zinc ion-binding protein n=1 Tax=Prunus dulcis TaxID=3755 RepID=A0A4Y1QQZ2_PRUDU|nr:zinc ion-binding protein [Prunus dulcis]